MKKILILFLIFFFINNSLGFEYNNLKIPQITKKQKTDFFIYGTNATIDFKNVAFLNQTQTFTEKNTFDSDVDIYGSLKINNIMTNVSFADRIIVIGSTICNSNTCYTLNELNRTGIPSYTNLLLTNQTNVGDINITSSSSLKLQNPSSSFILGSSSGFGYPFFLRLRGTLGSGIMLIYSNFSGSWTATTILYSHGLQSWFLRDGSGNTVGTIEYIQPGGSQGAIIFSNGTDRNRRGEVGSLTSGDVYIASSPGNWQGNLSLIVRTNNLVDLTNINVSSNATFNNLIRLKKIVLPACTSSLDEMIGRNETGIYCCNSTNWMRLGSGTC